jgi:hypothetical protein
MVGGTTNPNLLTTRRPIGSTRYYADVDAADVWQSWLRLQELQA